MQHELEIWAAAVTAAVAEAIAGRDDLAAVKVFVAAQPFAIPITRRFLEEVTPARSVRVAIEGRSQPRWALAAPVSEALWGTRTWGADADLTDALQRHLAELDTFALAVSPADHGSWRFAERHMGAERVEALLGEPAVPQRRERVIPRSLDELASILRAADVPAALVERARWGLELRSGEGASKLGGRPDLPGAWPLHAGHGLTHLASIALAELPQIAGRELLPAGGTLVFFADFHIEHEGDAHAVLYVPEGAAERPVAPPAADPDQFTVPIELPERRIAFEPRLSLPVLEDLFEEDEAAVDRLVDILDEPTHLILGHPVFFQGEDPVAAGRVNLLHLGWDEDWGFEYADGGQVTFHGTGEDIRAARWDRIQVLFESS